ncbi:hypothetical protein [Natronorubrum daqingense]|uniref:Uncharacterized protein n=1 Tax=Natronorubrum daqingense TaxID=588898 RepID=A0A1N7GAK1_9EURY|nr:hypothetical protein [Natronorubrum daqingense]SIS09534.1 hypothetical protein SAMN05421809_3840 [Natronorubrum daqingense]
MTDDADNTDGSEDLDAFSESFDHEATGSEKRQLGERYETVEKGGEVTDPSEMPDGGYTVAPTSNNPNQGTESDGDTSGDSD